MILNKNCFRSPGKKILLYMKTIDSFSSLSSSSHFLATHHTGVIVLNTFSHLVLPTFLEMDPPSILTETERCLILSQDFSRDRGHFLQKCLSRLTSMYLFFKKQMYFIHRFQLEEAFNKINLNKMGCLNPKTVGIMPLNHIGSHQNLISGL